MKKVLAFGAFDPLHEGHKDFFRQAKELGDHLTVIVARDSSVRAIKGYEPSQSEETRLAKIMAVKDVDDVRFGNKTAHHYEIFDELDFDVVALGYDQQPADDIVRHELNARSKNQVRVVRLKPFHPEKYKATYIRRQNLNDGQ